MQDINFHTYYLRSVIESIYERGGIVVRAHASHADGLRFEHDSMFLNARSLFTRQQMGTQWEHWGDKGGEERNWPPYLTCRWLRISVLSNRHSTTYENIRDYLYRVNKTISHIGQKELLVYNHKIIHVLFTRKRIIRK